MRRDLSHKTAPLLVQLTAARPFHLIGYSVWPRVRLPVALFTFWAGVVYTLHSFGHLPNVGSTGSLTAILSMVTGLMVSFRSGSSYDRWYEGRRTWASIQSTSRTLLRTLSFSLPLPSSSNAHQIAAIHELCSLVCAFPYATMQSLRDRPGVSHPQLRALLPPALVEAMETGPSNTLRNTLDSPLASKALPESNPFALPSTLGTPSSLPLAVIRALHLRLNVLHALPMAVTSSHASVSTVIDGPTWGSCLGGLKEYTDQLTALERIRDTPIPLILNLHLQLLLLVYIAAVPLQLVNTLGIFSIPATSLVCLVFYGVDRAGEELSDPFGTEPNDLPLARFCMDIHREYLELVGEGVSDGSSGK